MTYAVILVHQPDGENVEHVECLGTASTYEEATLEREKVRNEITAQNRKVCEYIDVFIDSIEFPEDQSALAWLHFLKKWSFVPGSMTRDRFRAWLKYYLTVNPHLKIEGFDPPKPSSINPNLLFVVELNTA